MATLCKELVCSTCQKEAALVTQLMLSRSNIQTISDLSTCSKLEKIDLSSNIIENADGLRQCCSLRSLNVSNNKLESISFVIKMRELRVLTASNNEIKDVSPMAKLKKLKALILNNNKIRDPIPIQNLSSLNTLVLSHNSIKEIDVRALGGLTKLQLSHNCIESFPNIKFNPDLKSLSLNDNRIKNVPEDCLGENRLEMLELGKNEIKKVKNITSLGNLKSLKQLNLQGNAICSIEDNLKKIRAMVPTLKTLNSKKVEKLFERKVKSEEEVSEYSDVAAEDGTKKRKREEKDCMQATKMKIYRKGKITEEAGENTGKLSKIDQTSEKPESEGASSIGLKSQRKRNNKEETETDVRSKAAPSELVRNKVKGIPALQDKTSGVVAIEVKKSKNQKRKKFKSTEDIFSAFTTSVGSGCSSSW